MSAPINIERFLGGFAWFIESGTTVDAITVSPTAKPDVMPLTNWTDHSLGSILSLVLGNEETDLSFSAPSATGGWEKRPRKVVTQDYLDMKSREMGELLLRLQFGLGPIVEGTAQTPFASTARYLDGWLRLQAREEPGTDLLILDTWARMELKKGIIADGKVTEPEFRMTVIKTYNGAAIAGNSIVFPA